MSQANKALEKTISCNSYRFDDQTYIIRRNLMIFSSISIGLTFVSPMENSGKYEVNIGIIKGVIDNPNLLYSFLALVCGYYLVWFYIHCQHTVVNNYKSIKNSFLRANAKLNAENDFENFNTEYEQHFTGVPVFAANSGPLDSLNVLGHISAHALRNYPELIDKLILQGLFSVVKRKDGYDISYVYKATDSDLIYLNGHLDLFWRGRRQEAFVTIFPIAYAVVSILLIVIHVWQSLKS